LTEDRWSELRTAWHKGTPRSARADDTARRVVGVERSRRRAALVRGAVALLAVSGLVAAVVHAANVLELVLAITVGSTIAATWLVSARAEARRRDMLALPAASYLAARRAALEAELRGLRFVWVVLALELVFFVPWWIGGLFAHAGALLGALTLSAVFVPAALAVALAIATARRQRVLGRERRRLEDAWRREQHDEPEPQPPQRGP
jgi:hypothetical protein